MPSRLVLPGFTSLLFLLLITGCAKEEPSIPLGPPEGWHADRAKWWRNGVDTSMAFRPMETLSDMNVVGAEPTYFSDRGEARRTEGTQDQLVHAVKQSLIRLYRNQPVVVDSLFERYVTPEIRNTSTSEDPDEYVDRYRSRAYQLIRSHFREPLVAREIGKDIPVPPYPDSLREKRVEGTVRFQVFLDTEGKPLAIKRLEGVHPVLDAMALRLVTQMEWSPAYYLRKGNWHPGQSWARYNLTFSPGA